MTLKNRRFGNQLALFAAAACIELPQLSTRLHQQVEAFLKRVRAA